MAAPVGFPRSALRGVLAGIVLVPVAILSDAWLLLQPAGAVLAPVQAAVLVVAAVVAAALSRWAAAPALLIAPVLGFALFRAAFGSVIEVPDDAVIRDAQAGLAVAVVVGAQLAIVALALFVPASFSAPVGVGDSTKNAQPAPKPPARDDTPDGR